MKNRMKIILDYDDVLVNCNQAAVSKLNADTGCHFTINDIKCWGSMYSQLDDRLEYFNDPEFIRSLQPLPGAIQFVSMLLAEADVFICTSVNPKCAGARIESICQHFPMISPSNILIGSRKDLIQADMLLDDGFHNIESANVTYPVLFRQPWNYEFTGILAISNYHEFLTLVKLIKESWICKENTATKVVSLVGPSGAGKTELAEVLCSAEDSPYAQVSSYTTGYPKNDSDNYNYVTEDEFLRLNQEGYFFETATYMGNRYGTAREDVDKVIKEGKIPLLILEINGAIAMKRHYGAAALNVFIKRDRTDCIRAIIERELDTEEKVKRISSLDTELKNEEFCDIAIENNVCIDKTLKEIQEAIYENR